jgi:soluble lytic murein transglycosylase
VLLVGLGPLLRSALRKLALPLEDARAIRAQASADHLDPALIAAVIYAETKFDARTSPTGARGLMQIEPETAAFIAAHSGRQSLRSGQLSDPATNIAYGSWYLGYLLHHYDGQEVLALAAYNAGIGSVDRWLAESRSAGGRFGVAAIPFPQTRAYVERVLAAQREYRELYPRELGLRRRPAPPLP